MSTEIDMSECVVEVDESSEYTYKDKALELFVDYVNENTEFNIKKSY